MVALSLGEKEKMISQTFRKQLIIAFIICFVVSMISYYGYRTISEVSERYFDEDLQQLRMVSKIINKGAYYEIDCTAGDVDLDFSGDFEKIQIPKRYSYYNGSLDSAYVMRDITETNFVPDHFDLKGLSGLNCRIKGGVNHE